MNAFPATPYLIALAFLLAVVVTAVGGLIAILSRRLIRSVCGLAICCFGLAGLYYFLHSPFLTLMEILIYVGAVCVTIVFGVMLAEPDEAPEPATRAPVARVWGIVALGVSGVACWGIARLGIGHPWTVPPARINTGSVEEIGVALLTTYSLAFEVISLVLVVAILGALVIARYGRTKP